MKKLSFLKYVYILALALSFVGYWLDSDTTTNSLAYQMFEVFMLSLFLFGILSVICLLFWSLFISIKGLLNR